MHNQSSVPNHVLYPNQWAIGNSAMQARARLKQLTSGGSIRRLRELATTCAAAVAAFLMLAGGVWLFLVQLANYGW